MSVPASAGSLLILLMRHGYALIRRSSVNVLQLLRYDEWSPCFAHEDCTAYSDLNVRNAVHPLTVP